jgi:hypothetical protein
MEDEKSATNKYKRPVRTVILSADAAPLAKKGIVGGGDEIRDLGWLYSSNFEWINEAFAKPVGRSS